MKQVTFEIFVDSVLKRTHTVILNSVQQASLENLELAQLSEDQARRFRKKFRGFEITSSINWILYDVSNGYAINWRKMACGKGLFIAKLKEGVAA